MSRLQHINPDNITVSDFNERKENISNGDLAESVEQNGVIQPVIVRERDATEAPYEVVIGQRRVLAAQSVDCSVVPAVIVEWEDAEALEKSITENIDAFQNDVSKKDRAKAIERLKEMRNLTNQDVADSLGVDKSVVSEWLEYTRDEWEGTSLDPNESEEVGLTQQSEPEPRTTREVRQMTGGGEEGEEVLEQVQEENLSQNDVREAREKVETEDKEPQEAIEEVNESKDGSIDVSVKFTGDKATAIEQAAEDKATRTDKIIQEAVETYLESEGYL